VRGPGCQWRTDGGAGAAVAGRVCVPDAAGAVAAASTMLIASARAPMSFGGNFIGPSDTARSSIVTR
jgi:hypothetical protein